MSRGIHSDLEEMLRATINRGTGRNAALPVANFGKTGTTQDYRDALFVGYAGDLVVGVWIGNDDNSPLNGVTGGSLPAKIWRDFMRGALGIAAAPAPKASDTPDPEGPVQPLDVLEGQQIPVGQDGAQIRIEGGGVTISQPGVPVEVRVGESGLVVQPAPSPSPSPPN
jgi:penicillin-binding protein 1A